MGADGLDRLASLDQFRGFAVLGMYVVNFLGHFQVTPEFLRHHAAYATDHGVVTTYVTYADMVMPQFFLAADKAVRYDVIIQTMDATRGDPSKPLFPDVAFAAVM